MPHIVFDKKIDLNDFANRFSPIFKKDSYIIKISRIFVDSLNFSALLPVTAISTNHQKFLIEISTTDMKTTLRLYPLTDPVKTDPVKLSLVLLGNFLLKIYPDLKIRKTNLSEYIEIGMT